MRPRFDRIFFARLFAVASLAFIGVTPARFAPEVMASSALALVATLLAGRRRFRFMAATALGVSGCLQLLALITHVAGYDLTWAAAASSLCAALGAVTLMWPRLSAARETAPLPQLSGTWALLSTLLVASVNAVLLCTTNTDLVGNSNDALLFCGAGALLLFGGFMIASHTVSLRWLFQPLFAFLSLSLCMSLGSQASHMAFDTRLATSAAPALMFALGFDWIRAGRTSVTRALRAGSMTLVLALAPALFAAPHQMFVPLVFARALAEAAAYALVAGLMPRVAAHRRYSPAWVETRRPWRVAFAVVVTAVVPVVATALRFRGEEWTSAVTVAVIAATVAMLAMIRTRALRALAWLVAMTPVIVCAVTPRSGPLALVLATGAAAFVSWLLSSPSVAQHFPRRVRYVPEPRPRVSLVLGGAGAALLLLTVLVGLEPKTRGDLLSQLPAPVVVGAPLLFVPPPIPTPDAAPLRVGSAVVTDTKGRGTWVVDAEKNALVLMDEHGNARVIPVGAWPQLMVVDVYGNAYVTCREAGELDVVDADFQVHTLPLPGEPRGLSFDRWGERLYIGLVTARELVEVDRSMLLVVARRDLPWAPYEVAATQDDIAVLPRVGGGVLFVSWDLERARLEPLITNGREAWHGQALTPVGNDLLVTFAAVDTGMEAATVTSEGGYGGTVSTPVELRVAVLHQGHSIIVPPVLEGALSGQGSDITGSLVHDGKLELISRGNGQMLTIDLKNIFHPRVDKRSALGQGATGLALSPTGALLTFAAFDRVLQSISEHGTDSTLAFSASSLDAQVQLGRRLFHRSDDNRLSTAGLACATCHPDGREDGLVWRFKGTQLQTPMLAAKLSDTAPYNWHGSTKTLEDNVGQTLKRLGGVGVTAEERAALARYLREGLHAPKLPGPKDAPLVALGRDVFTRGSVGCSDCHALDGTLTDGARHDVGTLSARELSELEQAHADTSAEFDTPSLIGVGQTAPYFHNGSAPSLESLIANNDDRMGHTSHLSDREKDALVAFLKTL